MGMEYSLQQKNQIFYRCFFGYLVSGMMTISIGMILPMLMEATGIGYIGAGAILSFVSIGNFFGSFVYAYLSKVFGGKNTVSLLVVLLTIYFFALLQLPNLYIMYVIMMLIGITKGCVTVFNNVTMNHVFYENSAPKINLINAGFAIGAFSIPFVFGIFLHIGLDWRWVLVLLMLLAVFAAVFYFTTDTKVLDYYMTGTNHTSGNTTKEALFLQMPRYYLLIFIIFFYLGLEYSVNGWFVTYLKDSNIMSTEMAGNMVSFLWLAILFSRLFYAKISGRFAASGILFYNAVGLCIAFVLLSHSQSILWIVPLMLILGFFMASIFPLGFADARSIMQGNSLAASIFTSVSALGGILTPWLIGIISDSLGMSFAISTLLVNAVLILLLSFFNYKLSMKGDSYAN